jgi:hypothetical protein
MVFLQVIEYKAWKGVVRPEGFEPPTLYLEDLGFENLNILIEKSKGKEEIHDLIHIATGGMR